jgi:hypothetical protein
MFTLLFRSAVFFKIKDLRISYRYVYFINSGFGNLPNPFVASQLSPPFFTTFRRNLALRAVIGRWQAILTGAGLEATTARDNTMMRLGPNHNIS